MDKTTVKELMVPLAEYATVGPEATLYDAVEALQQSQSSQDQGAHKHRSVLVYGEDGDVMGKISQTDILRGLEPGYEKISQGRFSHYNFNPGFIKTMMQSYNLWSDPLDNICNRSREIKAKKIMHTPGEGEYVDLEATLGEAIHQLIIGHEQSLLVTSGGKVIGILKLTDVFATIANILNECT